MYYDSHCHLNMLSKKDLGQALTGAKEKNVSEMISCSTSFASNKQNLLLTKNFANIKAAIGLYPLDALELGKEELDRAFGFFKNHITDTIAIGEVGIDYKYTKNEEDKKKQEEVFIRFINLAKKYDKPLIIHSRYAQRQALNILEGEKATKVLMHSFVDSGKLIKKATELGYFVGVGESVLFNEEVQKRVTNTPIENMLFETDSPISFNGTKSVPNDIPKIAQKVAELKELDLIVVEKEQEKNYHKLFS